MLSRDMPVKACVEYIGVTDKRVWRVIKQYVSRPLLEMNLSKLKAIGLDETASKRGHNDVTVFIDMDRTDKPVLFATSVKGKQAVKDFWVFLEAHQGKAEISLRCFVTCPKHSWRLLKRSFLVPM